MNKNEQRLSTCCAEQVLGNYQWGMPDEPPRGLCSGCGRMAKFYTEKEFEDHDRELIGRNYGELVNKKSWLKLVNEKYPYNF